MANIHFVMRGFLAIALFCSWATAAIQYCHKDELVNLCLGMVTAKNETSSGTDLFITLGFEGTATTGWMALGIGEQMAGALMFLMIADQQKNAVVSVRTTEGHFQPQLAPDRTPVAEILSINSQTDTWQEYAFVCYACDKWATFNPSEKSHPFIWARGLNQKFKTAALDARIGQHDHYSLFWVDMTQGALASGEPTIPPPLDRNKGSFGASDYGSPSGSSNAKVDPGFTAARAHGLLLALAFMVLFPAGAVVLNTGYRMAFKAHVALQLVATLSVLVGVIFIAWPVVKNDGFKTLLDGHPLFGTILVVLVITQIWLGWWHHRNFVKLQRNTAPTFAHRWNGRLLLILGAVNTAFGIVFAKERAAAKLIWGTLAAIEAIVFLIVMPELVRRKEQFYESPAKQHVHGEERGHLLETFRAEQ
ncbi:CBD9-like protein [Xylariaceae sp. AK1471]|nr:CBD9-like protein [Xylariaceae sp. AK1471]